MSDELRPIPGMGPGFYETVDIVRVPKGDLSALLHAVKKYRAATANQMRYAPACRELMEAQDFATLVLEKFP